MQNLVYNGCHLKENIFVDEYDRKSDLVKNRIPLNSLLKGTKCVGIFSNNNCSDCAKQELELLNNLGLEENLLIIYDSPIHQLGYIPNIKSGYYEISSGELIDGIAPGSELPIILLVEDGRIVSSCVASGISLQFTKLFHEYLRNKILNENVTFK